jgi:hypothetical protein
MEAITVECSFQWSLVLKTGISNVCFLEACFVKMVSLKSLELCYTANTNVTFFHTSDHALEFIKVYSCIALVRKIQALGQYAEVIVI